MEIQGALLPRPPSLKINTLEGFIKECDLLFGGVQMGVGHTINCGETPTTLFTGAEKTRRDLGKAV